MTRGRKDKSSARVEQYTTSTIGSIERHNERKNGDYGNINVDPERIPMNIYFKSPGDKSYMDILRDKEASGEISRRGLRAEATVFDEMELDINTLYFEEHGGYEFAKKWPSRTPKLDETAILCLPETANKFSENHTAFCRMSFSGT